MNKLFYFILLVGLVSACSKEKRLEKRLDGNWDIAQLDYNATIPVGGFGFPISNSVTNVGAMSFNRDNGTSTYNMNFNASAIFLTDTINLPVNISGSGKFTNTDKTVEVTDNLTGEKRVFNIETDEKTRQVWTTMFPVTIPFGTDTLTTNANLKIYLNKK